MGDSVGAARLAAADERINRALADAVERHADKEPGVRGILKRASATCHPKSESHERVAPNTEQDSTPQPPVSNGESSHQAQDPAPPQGLHSTSTRVT